MKTVIRDPDPREAFHARVGEIRELQTLALSGKPIGMDSTVLSVSRTSQPRAYDRLRSWMLGGSRYDGNSNDRHQASQGLYVRDLYKDPKADSVYQFLRDGLVRLVGDAAQSTYFLRERARIDLVDRDIWLALSDLVFFMDAKARGYGIPARALPDLVDSLRTAAPGHMDPLQEALFWSLAAIWSDTNRLAAISLHPLPATACLLVSQGWIRAGQKGRGENMARNCPSVLTESFRWTTRSDEWVRTLSLAAWAALGVGRRNEADSLFTDLCQEVARGNPGNGLWLFKALSAAGETCGSASDRDRVQWRTDSGAWRELPLHEGSGSVLLPDASARVALRWASREGSQLVAELAGTGSSDQGGAADSEVAPRLHVRWFVNGLESSFPDSVVVGDELQCRAKVVNWSRHQQGVRLKLDLPGGWMFTHDRVWDFGYMNIRSTRGSFPSAGTNSVKLGVWMNPADSAEWVFSARAEFPGSYGGGGAVVESMEEDSFRSFLGFGRSVVLPSRDSIRLSPREARP